MQSFYLMVTGSSTDSAATVSPSAGERMRTAGWSAAEKAAVRINPKVKAILDRIPASRWGEPADLGGTAVFLASRASDYVNGAVIPVDGGWLAR